MYQLAYTQIVDESSGELRAHERHAMDRTIELLTIARERGPGTVEEVDALYYVRRLWAIFMDDLGNPENELPKELRASLFSIGLWMLKEIDRVRTGATADLTPMIEINEIIRDGLK